MNPEVVDFEQSQRQHWINNTQLEPEPHEAKIRTDHQFATLGRYARDDDQAGHSRNTRATASDQAASGSQKQQQSPVVYESPEGSVSDESMNDFENVISPQTPPQAHSPGPTAALGRLSLDQNSSDNRGSNQRGRASLSGDRSASKRAASSELPRPEKPNSPQRNDRNPSQYGPNRAKFQNRQRQRFGPKFGAARVTSAAQHEHARGPKAFTGVPESRYPVARDSGYETMGSRQSSMIQSGQVLDAVPKGLGDTQSLYPLAEESKGVVTRLAGPVPVLIDSRYPKLIMQPESSPISQDQLAAEVKGIYGGLVMVEAKCINIDAAQAADPNSSLGAEQWQALIALHRTLLYEHHDFLMATQHPSATQALKSLAQKYSMPARMWRHGIHAFLEVLRHRRPQSQDYMLSFIYLAYQMMALLYETVTTFTDTWIECLGDLARYRMAIEEEKEAHSIWGGVAARWYNMASDRHPQIGRLYHHLGILERPSLRKMYMYAKSLTCVIPFPNARDSLNTLCSPVLQGHQPTQQGLNPAEAKVVNYYTHLFGAADTSGRSQLSADVLLELSHQSSSNLRDNGVFLIVTNIASLFELGSATNQLWACFSQSINKSIHASRPSAAAFPASNDVDSHADAWPVNGTAADEAVYNFCYSSFHHIMNRGKDRQSLRDVLPSVHTTLAWLHGIYAVQSNSDALDNTLGSLFDRFDWVGLCSFLNTLIQYEPISGRTRKEADTGSFPGSGEKDDVRPKPLSEDFLIRGLIWCHSYYPEDWFSCQAEDDGRFFETPAMHKTRVERVHWHGLFLSSRTPFIKFIDTEQRFYPSAVPNRLSPSITEKYEEPIKSSGHAEEQKRASTPKSRSSTTLSAHSDSEGYTVINTPKSRMSYAKVASNGHDGIKVIDDDHDVDVGI